MDRKSYFEIDCFVILQFSRSQRLIAIDCHLKQKYLKKN